MILAPHLTWEEVLAGSGVASPDELPPGVRLAIKTMAAHLWTPLRRAWGRPLRVVSGGGYRSPEVNRAVDGKPRSPHMQGRALDLVPGEDPPLRSEFFDLYDRIDQLQRCSLLPGGLCLYLRADGATPRFLHADCRGRRARWGVYHRCTDGRQRWCEIKRQQLPAVG